MKRRGPSLWLLTGIFALGGCGGQGTASPNPDPDPGPDPQLGATSAIHVVEVTTVTTVQSSSGVFLSPRPSVAPPAYLEPGSAAPLVSFPDAPLATDRAKLSTALLFRADVPGSERFRLDATLTPSDGSSAPPSVEHFFPKLNTGATSVRWALELSVPEGTADPELESDSSSEWT